MPGALYRPSAADLRPFPSSLLPPPLLFISLRRVRAPASKPAHPPLSSLLIYSPSHIARRVRQVHLLPGIASPFLPSLLPDRPILAGHCARRSLASASLLPSASLVDRTAPNVLLQQVPPPRSWGPPAAELPAAAGARPSAAAGTNAASSFPRSTFTARANDAHACRLAPQPQRCTWLPLRPAAIRAMASTSRSRSGNYVPLDDHLELLDKFKEARGTPPRNSRKSWLAREAERDATCQGTSRRCTTKPWPGCGTYIDEKMEARRLQTDDKLEHVEDKAQDALLNEVGKLAARISDMDEALIRLEERLQTRGDGRSMSLTPLVEAEASQQPWPSSGKDPWRRAGSARRGGARARVGRPRRPRAVKEPPVCLQRRQHRVPAVPDARLPPRPPPVGPDEPDVRQGASRPASRPSSGCRRRGMPLQCLRSSDMSICELRAALGQSCRQVGLRAA